MNFAIPRKNQSDLVLYIWKIIDLPYITLNDLMYKISFELFLLSPQNAEKFIQTSIENKLLEIDEQQTLTLSRNLKKKLHNWQLERKENIISKVDSAQRNSRAVNNFKTDKSSNFNILLKAFLDKGTINRTVSLSEQDFKIEEFNFEKGSIKSEYMGSKKEPYVIEINTRNQKLIHNCHDFQTRRSQNKKFCKHLAKLFLLLKEKDQKAATNFLSEIAENINKWEFMS